MKKWQISKLFNEVLLIGFLLFVCLTWLETTKKEDLVIVSIVIVSYSVARIKTCIEKNKKFERRKIRNKKFSKKEKESE